MKSFNDIKPTQEQMNCISYKAGDLLVNGIPGAGKSIVLLKRALEFYKASRPGEKNVVLLTTFSNTLKDYTNDVFQQAGIDEQRMSIITLDSYCSKIYYRFFGRFDTASDDERIKYVEEALQKHYQKHKKDHRFYKVDDQFWCEEFLWMKQKNILTQQEYHNAERTGRGGGVRITRDERKMVFEMFQEYCAVLKKHRKIDWEDIYAAIINSGINLTNYKYKYVLVDEAQDLSFVKLKVAKMLSSESITIAADKAQKIYNTAFTWKELGIDIRGNASKTLHKTFRSTKQIVQLAESLLEVNRAREGDSGEYTDPVLPTLLGEDYPYVIRCASIADEKLFIGNLVKSLLSDSVTIGILYRNYKEKTDIANLLGMSRIGFEEIKKGTGWSLRKPGVKLTTLHSSKGLEFDIVIIPFFSNIYYPVLADMEKADPEQKDEIMSKERSLLYVGMTRAKSALYFTYSGSESLFLSEFEPAYYNYFSSADEELEKPARSFVPPRKNGKEDESDGLIAELLEVDKQITEKRNLLESTGKTVTANSVIDAHYLNGGPVRFMASGVLNIGKWPFLGKKVGDVVHYGGNNVVEIDNIYSSDTEKIRGKIAALEEKRAGIQEQIANLSLQEKKSTNAIIWDEAESLIDSSLLPFVRKLRNQGFPEPTTIGSELMGPDGSVIAKAELAWELLKIVLLRRDQKQFASIWEERNWTVATEETELSLIINAR